MILTTKLAVRNMLAHRRRSLTMVVVVGLVSCVVFLLLAFSDGQLDNLDAGVLSLSDPSADVAVYATGLRTAYDQGEDWAELSSHAIRPYPKLLEELRSLPFVRRAVSPTSPLSLDLQAGGQRHENFLVRGVDTTQPWLIQERLHMKEGTFLDGSAAPQLILHYKTASTVGVRPGEKVTLTGKNRFGQVVVQEATLVGYFAGEQDMPRLGELGFMNLAAYQLVAGFAPDETMSLFLDLQPGETRQAALRRLTAWARERKLALEFWDFDQRPELIANATDMRQIYGLFRLVVVAAVLVVLFIVAFGVMSVVSLNLHDRRKEIATYYCLGTEKRFLVGLYTLEILLINLGSAAAGVAAGLGIRQVINSLRIRTEVSGLQLVFGGSQFSLGFSHRTVVFIVGAIVILSVVTALTTLGSRLRVSPVSALREVA